jgi:hypothetical protein
LILPLKPTGESLGDAEYGREMVSSGPDPDSLTEEERFYWYGPPGDDGRVLNGHAGQAERLNQINGVGVAPPIPPRQSSYEYYT